AWPGRHRRGVRCGGRRRDARCPRSLQSYGRGNWSIAVLGSVSRPPMEDALITECPPRSVGGDPCLRAAAFMSCSQLIRVKTCARSACEAGSLLQICLQSVVLGLRVSRGGNCTYGAARRQTLLHRRVLWQLVLRLLSHAFASAVEPVRQLSHVMS